MANSTFRAATVDVDGKKVAEAQTSTFAIKNGGAEVVGLEGILGISDGVTSCTCEIDSMVPVAGLEISFVDILLGRRYVTIGYFVDGRLLQATGKINAMDYSSDSKSGEVKGKISFTGGEPKLTY